MLPPAPSEARDQHRPQALFITRKNALAVIGQEWTWCLRAATDLGVPVVKFGKKKLISAAKFVVALERGGAHTQEPEIDPAEQIRRALGVKKVGAR